jgi:hypothetical protein
MRRGGTELHRETGGLYTEGHGGGTEVHGESQGAFSNGYSQRHTEEARRDTEKDDALLCGLCAYSVDLCAVFD